ncbi:hypothetical protein [Nannocystis pusilla]|uniref:Uncharacterized protein n=1 Tax=Nannocystis pusilla TaxID=889268 RepID=A0ABS7TKI6_9BACT|nr:hypothetical protein [Nannocystis pusilla]MBZ5708747.1 hypothetical protein [Nannocystis pusilla]
MRDTLPVVNARSLLPRRHPSAWLALELSLSSIVLGPLLSVPALRFARRVRRQIADNHGHFTGAGLTRAAVFLAWSSCIAWAAAAATLVIALWPPAAYVVGSLGLCLAGFLLVRRASRPLAAFSAVAGLSVALLGLRVHDHILRERAIEQMHACEEANRAATSAWTARALDSARTAYQRAAVSCTGDRAEEAAIRLRDIDARAERAQQVDDEKARRYAATQAAQSLAQHDRDESRLHARFATTEQTAAARLVEARRHQQARRWEKASELLQSIDSDLAAFRGTKLEGTPRMKTLATEARTLADVIEPRLSKLRLRREADRRRKEEADAQRQAEAARRRERAESWSSNRVHCCDGTLSPTCTYGRSLRGCCSWHGGVC